MKLLLGQAVGLDELAEVGAENRQRESDGNADDADVLQRERGMRVDRHGPARADGDEPDGDQRAADQRRDRSPRVEPFPEKREKDGRQVGRGRDDKRDARDQGGRVGGGADACRKPDGQQADEACRDARHEHLLAIADVSVEDVGPDHIDVKVVAESSGCGERESGHDGEDGGKGDRRDERQQELTARTAEELSAEILSQTRSREVAVRLAVGRDGGADIGFADERRGAEAQERGHDVERPDQSHCPYDRLARGLGVGHREEPHQDMGKAGRAQNQRHAQRDVVEQGEVDSEDRLLAVLVEDAWLGEVEAGHLVLHAGDGVEEISEVETEVQQDKEAEQDRAPHQEHRFDDLHPGGRDHAARDDVDHHQHADDGDRRVELGAKHSPVEPWLQGRVERRNEDLDQAARPNHLGHHVGGADGDGRERSRRTDWDRRHPVRKDIGKRVLARVAHRLGDQKQYRQIGDEPANRVHEAVVAIERDQTRDAEKRSRAHVVA